MMRLRAWLLTAILVTAASAFAADAPAPAPALSETPPTIRCEGSATVEVEPEYMEFWLSRTVQAETLEAAADKLVGFEEDLKKKIEDALLVAELKVSSPVMPDLNKKEASIVASVRFAWRGYQEGPDRSKRFGKLCDQMTALATASETKIEGPKLGIINTDAVIETAVAKAAENAYPAGRAAALALSGQIVSVDRMSVDRIEWDKDPETKMPQPDTDRIRCTAKVTITYIFSAQ
jgi:uncharacterized protein YggE